MRLKMVLGLLVALVCPAAAIAGPAADTLARHLYAGSLKAAAAEMTANDDESRAALGILKFMQAIEHLAQDLHAYGLENATGRIINVPILRLPVPPNPAPKPLTYGDFRSTFSRLVSELDEADRLLASSGTVELKFPLDLLQVKLDIDGDGKAAEYESIAAMLRQMMRAEVVPPSMQFSFDRADIHWLRGYASFISAVAQFMLAHDFEATFDKTFHMYFPRAGLPLASALLPRGQTRSFFNEFEIADGISFIHLLNWKVAEPARLADVRRRLKAIAANSKASWQAARAETDDDHEWLPNAKQTSALAPVATTDQTIDGWLAVMAEFDAVLDGRKLMPHWRFEQGLNLKKFFETSRNFDAVLIVAGPDAVPYLEQGPVSSSADWNALMAVFQGNFLNYALFYN